MFPFFISHIIRSYSGQQTPAVFAGLVPAVLLDAEGREVKNADPNCGLFIRSRQVGLAPR